MRLGAYAGVMAARIEEERRAEERGGTPSAGRRGPAKHDPNLVGTLVAEGWAERNTIEGA